MNFYSICGTILKNFFLLFICFYIGFNPSVWPEDINLSLEYNKKADQYLSEKNFMRAIAELEKAEKVYKLDGYYATKIGFIYNWNLNNYEMAIQNLERALKQGGDKKPWTLREYGYVLMKIEQYDTSEEFLKMALDLSPPKSIDQLESLGYISVYYNKIGKYEESIESSLQGYSLDLSTDNFNICSAYVSSSVYLAHIALSKKNYNDAIKFFKQAEKVGQRNSVVSDYLKKIEVATQREITEERKRLGKINPIYENKILGLFIKNTNVSFIGLNGKTVSGKSIISRNEVDRAILFQKILKEFIESMSGGNYTISFENQEINATLNELKVSTFGGLDTRQPVFESITPSLENIYFINRNKYDTFAIYWNGENDVSTTANGGAFQYPYINYQLYSPNRGYISFPTNWKDESLAIGITHEFFHNIEALVGISPTHGFDPSIRNKFSEWKGSGQLDYFRWHFKTNLPRVLSDRVLKEQPSSWKNLGWLNRFPDVITQEDYDYNKRSVAKISLEAMKKSYELSSEAYSLYWEQGNKEKADPLFLMAFQLNPYNPNALRYMGDLELSRRNYNGALEHYKTLSKINPYPWTFRMVIKIQQWDLKDIPGALDTYTKFFERYPNEKENYIIPYGRALFDANLFEEALEIFEKGLDHKDQSKPTVKAQAHFWKGLILCEKKGDIRTGKDFIKTGIEEGYKDEFTMFYYKKYLKR
jgi:tetratricopeptide (TPR) repeat protein